MMHSKTSSTDPSAVTPAQVIIIEFELLSDVYSCSVRLRLQRPLNFE